MQSLPRVAGAIATALFGATIANAALPSYETVELEARSNLLVNDNGFNLPPGSSFNSISADINASAEVAFRVQVVPDADNPGQSRPGVWAGGHGNGSLIYTGPIDASVDNDACLNDSGDIAFTLSDGGVGNNLYLYDATAGSASAIGTLPVIPNSYGNPCVNEAGDIGFQASFSSGRAFAARIGGSTAIYTGDAGTSPGSPYTYLYTPSFNRTGIIAAKVATSSDQFTKVEIRTFASDGTSQLVLANASTDAQSPYSRFDNSLALSDNGIIAVVATRVSDNRRVVVRSDGITTTEIAAVDPAGTVRELDSFAPAINDSGWVAFRAKDAAGQAIYVGDGSALVRVIGNADAVATDLGLGQLGQNNATDPVFAGKPSINANGDIAFVAGVYPQGDNQTEWGSGVFVAYATNAAQDLVFADGFDGAATR
ncbi:MAG: choice-of-anchor tandem repeat NxxGxxAF-containing protein [Dokdonella sp.]|uniref:choice-of-anchor tandem repeat NxxGxxAF-containing protein n=1 Tax=Dokdonella sp. TaxID=2291710 RepID=UPI003267D4C7